MRLEDFTTPPEPPRLRAQLYIRWVDERNTVRRMERIDPEAVPVLMGTGRRP